MTTHLTLLRIFVLVLVVGLVASPAAGRCSCAASELDATGASLGSAVSAQHAACTVFGESYSDQLNSL
jgi:hypothetical protein